MRFPKYAHSFEVATELPEALKPLSELAFNFRWTWDHSTRDLFREIDRPLWDAVGHNPVQLLARVPRERLEQLAADPVFVSKLSVVSQGLRSYMEAKTWFDGVSQGLENTTIAYFCAEFGISEALPIYSGGLGVLAGDHLKAASDLGLPLVGVGLLYSRGYFRQSLNPEGWQQERYPEHDFYGMPLKLMTGADDQPLRIQVEFPDRVVTCQIWKAQVGRVPLYLLDSNVLENQPSDKGITDTLYGGDEEMRIRQEMILGIGGLRALQAMNIQPTVCHMNEGHAAFLSIERIRQFMQATGADFRTARQVCVNGNVFTTHTPVPAGFDLFTADLLKRYMEKSAQGVGLSFDQFQRLGKFDPENEGEAFNMAVLAMENSNHINGVSKLHAAVSRSMFHARWADYPESETPIEAITNGIHVPTWISRKMARLFDTYLGEEWRNPDAVDIWQKVQDIPDSELWELRENQRGDLVRYVRKRVQMDWERRNAVRADFGLISTILDPRILTIGFARRFATYKRATLLLQDRDRLKSLLFHSERPIQIVFAGKSHPRDDGGKTLIKDLFNFIEHEGARTRMVFVEDYDMEVARALVQGVDVWLNNPMRPMEASGTSGMKVLPNGGLNCSILDGWWDEAYAPGLGWAIGDRDTAPDNTYQNWIDSRSLYQVIEQEIAPRFYHRVDGGMPKAWIDMMKRSIAELTPRFSTGRMVKDYATKFYFPAAKAYLYAESDNLSHAKEAIEWRDRVKAAWKQVRVVGVSAPCSRVNAIGAQICVKADVSLGPLSPDEVNVQALVGQIGHNGDLIDAKPQDLALTASKDGVHTFEGHFTCDRPGHMGYTIRVMPKHPHVFVPHELPLVAWEESARPA